MMIRNYTYGNTTVRVYEGYMVELLDKLAQLMDFRYKLFPVDDGSFGFPQRNGTWTGLMGEVISKVRIQHTMTIEATLSAVGWPPSGRRLRK